MSWCVGGVWSKGDQYLQIYRTFTIDKVGLKHTFSYSEEDVIPVRSPGMFPPPQSHLDVEDSQTKSQNKKFSAMSVSD